MRSAVIFFLSLISGAALASPLPKGFVLVPKNPDFAFASSLDGKGKGEKSPINSDYAIAKYPVTNSEYKRYIDSNPRANPPKYWDNREIPAGKDMHPVVCVSYGDALDYCRWLSDKDSEWNYRLPTEAEWEYAASGDGKTEYPWGNSPDTSFKKCILKTKFNYCAVLCAYYLNSKNVRFLKFNNRKSKDFNKSERIEKVVSIRPDGRVDGWSDYKKYRGFIDTNLFKQILWEGGFTTPVDEYPEGISKFGCMDMSGNSSDWTSSDMSLKSISDGRSMPKVIRGGAWYSSQAACSATSRGEARYPDLSPDGVGFRLVAERKPSIGDKKESQILKDSKKNEQ